MATRMRVAAFRLAVKQIKAILPLLSEKEVQAISKELSDEAHGENQFIRVSKSRVIHRLSPVEMADHYVIQLCLETEKKLEPEKKKR